MQNSAYSACASSKRYTEKRIKVKDQIEIIYYRAYMIQKYNKYLKMYFLQKVFENILKELLFYNLYFVSNKKIR